MQTLTINGQAYAIKFSYSAIIDFCEKQGIEFHQYGDYVGKINFNKITNTAAKAVSTLIHCAIIRGCELTGTTLALTVNDIIDELFTDELLLVAALTAIQNDMPVKKKEISQVVKAE